jgi:hypothetical protein
MGEIIEKFKEGCRRVGGKISKIEDRWGCYIGNTGIELDSERKFGSIHITQKSPNPNFLLNLSPEIENIIIREGEFDIETDAFIVTIDKRGIEVH